ncbi:hypothetical protein Zm00014a_038562 [Zea mays]|uniref:Sodium/hydrogen exchanger 2 n=1 Tax=Zea mays TaxID=4577 RepID=A0A3L6EDA0_MAIZE|nr:hypothetical protein Zm00014a_038562 [Zea mays]PWZ18771.1 hypothetical protein Zm00014a_038562 [Zea mays]PWZ18772.1 hypothetical protein Zm00014a_038562 [Zea mays]PWZ18773.1 hypothetical protein Zm00014a_038562 [Zea mays]
MPLLPSSCAKPCPKPSTILFQSPLSTILQGKTLAILHEFQVLQVVAVGECGLDYDRLQFCPADMQKKFPGGVTHSFTDSAEDRDRLLSFEKMFIGVNGCSLKTNENLEVLRGIPVERLMIETDSPYCDIINTHVESQQVLEVVAGSKGISDIEGLSRTLYHSICRLFFPQDLEVPANA